MQLGLAVCVGFSLALLGCSSPQKVLLTAGPDQQAVIRDGVPVLVSKKKHLVMLRPNSRLLRGNARPAFTVVVRNQGRSPETLLEQQIRATQFVGGRMLAVRVYRYDELIKEEETRQAVATFGAALSATGRAMSASTAGYTNTTGSVTTQGPYGTTYGTYSGTTYDPLRAQAAQDAAAAESRADFDRIRAQGEANLMGLQATILKDNTVLPGEWYGGTIVLAAPAKADDGGKNYSIVVSFGGEEHIFAVSHVAN